jgi:hypothetical protein
LIELELKSAPTHGTRPEDLNANKMRQRWFAAKALSGHRTILELYAGEGNLSERVYARLNPRRMVLVDDDQGALERARQRLAKFSIKKEFYPISNERFIKDHLGRYSDISLVDFDPYGSPGRTVAKFFERYRVRQPMIVALTDGLPVDMRPWRTIDYMDMYSLGKSVSPPSVGEICQMHDVMMKNLGARSGFVAKRLNRDFGGRSGRAVYGAYLLRPVGTQAKFFHPILSRLTSLASRPTV